MKKSKTINGYLGKVELNFVESEKQELLDCMKIENELIPAHWNALLISNDCVIAVGAGESEETAVKDLYVKYAEAKSAQDVAQIYE